MVEVHVERERSRIRCTVFNRTFFFDVCVKKRDYYIVAEGFAKPHRLINTRLDSDDSYSLVQRWLNECSERHPGCDQHIYTKAPSRLLEVHGDKIYLRTLSELNDQTPKYATLSYCWGSREQNLETTTETLEKHQYGLDFTSPDMPKTLRDGIRVAQRLGIGYMWIDCLCIIQDSDSDWQAEAKSIGEYYRNSFLTISALNSTGADQGFLSVRSSSTGYQRFADTDLFMRRTPSHLDDIFQGAALSKRGWTLQERLLSKRTVHYGTNEIFWECSKYTARETSFEAEDESLNLSVMTSSKCTLLDSDLAFYLPSDIFMTWCKVVKDFSHRSLTYESDKRHAILGIASIVEKRTKSKFLRGGIFTDDLAGLLYLQYSESKGSPRRPTWSWLSTSGAVFFPFLNQTRCVSDWDATYLAESRTGRGDLCLEFRARRQPVRRSEIRSRHDESLSEGHDGSLNLFVEHIYDRDLLKRTGLSIIWICQFLQMSLQHPAGAFCHCGLDLVPEITTYYLLVIPGESDRGFWKRIGVVASYQRPECSSDTSPPMAGFNESRWENIRLV